MVTMAKNDVVAPIPVAIKNMARSPVMRIWSEMVKRRMIAAPGQGITPAANETAIRPFLSTRGLFCSALLNLPVLIS